VHCYQFVTPDKLSTSEQEPRRWYNCIKSKVATTTDETRNHVTEDKKKLRDLLVPIEKNSGDEEEDDQLS
jgi:hypothetical protein